jgi:hypothetical protein
MSEGKNPNGCRVTCAEIETFMALAAKMLGQPRERISFTFDRSLVPVPYPPGVWAEFCLLPDSDRIVVSVRRE